MPAEVAQEDNSDLNSKRTDKGEKPIVQSRCLWVPTPGIVAQKSEHLSSQPGFYISLSGKPKIRTLHRLGTFFSNIIPFGSWGSVFQPAQSTTLSADIAPNVESPQSLTTKSRSCAAVRSPRPLQMWCDDSKACAPEGLRDSSGLEERGRNAFQYQSGSCQVSLSPSPVSPGHVTCLVRCSPEALAKSLLCRTVLGLASCDKLSFWHCFCGGPWYCRSGMGARASGCCPWHLDRFSLYASRLRSVETQIL